MQQPNEPMATCFSTVGLLATILSKEEPFLSLISVQPTYILPSVSFSHSNSLELAITCFVFREPLL